MSIYRETFYRPGDVHATARAPDAPQQDMAEERYRQMRRGSPAANLLPQAASWAARLPAGLRPNALLAQYPRIANLLAMTWSDSGAFDTYMESLLIDKRGNRRGFPLDVQRELAALALAHSKVPSARSFR